MKLTTKLLLGLSMLTAASLSSAAMKSSENVRYIGDMRFSSFCKAAIDNDVDLLKRALTQKVGDFGSSRRAVLKNLTAENGMSCDGVSLVEFSKQRGADEVYAFLTQAS